MPQLTFYGATGTVTGSRFLLELKDKKFLIDCGLFQGPKENRLRNWDPFPIPPSEIDAVILTHAHIDHIGYLPRFGKDGFRGPIVCTYATAELSKILLKDSAHLQEEDARWANKKGFSKHSPALPLFTVEDAEACLEQFEPFHYGDDVPLADNIRLKLKDAGHILGSSLIDIKVTNNEQESKKIVFSGDLGRPVRAILRDPTQVYNVDYLVLESTYGDRLHDDTSFYDQLVKVINDSVARGGVLVIPSFAVGRTQTLMYVIRELEEQGKIPVLPVYVDSPMALEATTVYEKQIPHQNIRSRVLTIMGRKIFRSGDMHLCESRKKSKAINDVKSFAIIISSSGMITGGRILHHLQHRLPEPKNTILFVGYQAEGTRGRTILDGAPTVKIHGNEVPVRAKVESISGLSCHADYNETLAWLMGFNKAPRRTFVIHGESHASASLADKIRSRFDWQVSVPDLNESYLIDL
ncbi:MAG: MBL fold metallo-hydrolase [Candidatus Zixiibacteriota bacterium]|nr:MAG: MBL fold metallo-hydrolase [candidate division Zixibacteria bacterium]